MATRVILVRHGQSTFNAEKRYQGCSDESVLTERGFEMAMQTGNLLKDVEIDAIYSSPLKRTKQTACMILAQLQSLPQPKCHSNLREIAMPEWEGLSFKYVRSHLSESYRIWKERPHEFQMQQLLESDTTSHITTLTKTETHCFPVLDLYAQAQQFWRETIPQHEDETLLVVSHGGTIRALIGTAIGMGCQSFHALQQSNCGVSILNFPQGLHYPAQLEAMNTTHHLGEALPKLKEGKLGLRLVLVSAEDESYQQQLVQLLQPMKFDFCLSSDRSDALAQTLLDHHPESTVHLRIAQDHFFETWHQTLQAKSMQSDALTTGLIIAPPEAIRTAISNTMDIPVTPSVLALQPGSLNILQYPINHRPVLQAFNFSGEQS
jgi:phosphoserine phosphatase